MSQISKKFEEGKCRIESGLFFSDDTTCRISRSGKTYTCNQKEPLQNLMYKNGEDWWFQMEPHAECEQYNIKSICGGGSFDDEGFVALIEAGELKWIFHLDKSEAFNRVSIAGNSIFAKASNYPYNNIVEIPIKDPQKLKFTEIMGL